MPTPQQMAAHRSLVTPNTEGSGPSGGFSPADLLSAYKLPSGGGEGRTVAITIAFDNPNAESDLAKYREEFKLPACTTANGCFKKVNQKGEEGNYPAPDSSWAQETSLDLDMVSAVCPKCHIILVEADNNELENLGVAVEKAATLGADVISNSWLGPEFFEETSEDHYFNHPGIPTLFASGDNGYGTGYPATSSAVIAVGGTKLNKAANARGWSESAWSGAGSGCSIRIEKPVWQKDEGCAKRTIADVSAVADPATPVAVYDTYETGTTWLLFGGTSVATPLIAGIEAISTSTFRAAGPIAFTKAGLAGKFFDPTEGANGLCFGYLCHGEIGYDGPTGWGTPNGTFSLPVAVSEAATVTSTTAATLRGSVRPGGLATNYHFEYGETTGYGTTVPIPDKSAGSGNEYVEVAQAIEGLKGQRTYHYRITASNSEGTFHGVDRTFGTTPPTATTTTASEIHPYHATVKGTVNPEGSPTTYYFEYGPTTSYGTKWPLKAKEAGAGTSSVEVSSVIGGDTFLKGNTTYHYRVVAKNSGGTTYGTDKTFTTAVEEWQQGHFTAPPESSNREGNGVACPQANMCIGVGAFWNQNACCQTFVTLAEIWNGKKWSFMTTPNPPGLKEGWKSNKYARLVEISCSSTTDCMAVGYYRSTGEVVEPLAQHWNGTNWEELSVPKPAGAGETSLSGISCASAILCEAVGSYKDGSGVRNALIEHWNGSKWEVKVTHTKSDLVSVSCPSTTVCVAVGSVGVSPTETVYPWSMVLSSGAWKETSVPYTGPGVVSILAGVSCPTTTACTAVGGSSNSNIGKLSSEALAMRWNGSSWTQQSLPVVGVGPLESETLTTVSCPSASSCTAAGYYRPQPFAAPPLEPEPRPLIERWSGSVWSPLEAAPLNIPITNWQDDYLRGISCVEATACMAVGETTDAEPGQFAEYPADFAEWTATGPQATTEAASKVTPSTAKLKGHVKLNGEYSGYYFEYGPTTSYGTSTFEQTAYYYPANEESAEVSPEQTITGLSPGTTYHFRLVAKNPWGTSYGEDKTFTAPVIGWGLQSTPNLSSNSSLEDVSCLSEGECIAVGSSSSVPSSQRWNGSEWKLLTNSSDGSSSLTDVSCVASNACLAISSPSTLKAQLWNGSEWKAVKPVLPSGAETASFYGVSCASSTFCVAVGKWVKSTGFASTLAERWNGSEWTVLSTPGYAESALFTAVSCTSSTSCTAIGAKGAASNVPIALRWNGTKWTAMTAPQEVSNTAADISCWTDNACTAVLGESAKVERWNGTEWSKATVPTPEGGSAPKLYGVSCASESTCIATGSYTKESKTVTLGEGWNGSAWSVQNAANPEGGGALAGVSCPATNICTAVGYYAAKKTVAERFSADLPVSTTEAATSVDADEGTLKGTVNPKGIATSYWFEYGIAVGEGWKYETKIPVPAKEVGSGTSNVSVSQTAAGLSAGSTYHFRLVAASAAGTTFGNDKSFTTTSSAPQWSLQSATNPSSNVYLEDVFCASASECMAVGSSATHPSSERWNGTAWSTLFNPSEGVALSDVSCGSTSACLALLSTGTKAQRWSGGEEWSISAAITPAEAISVQLEGVSCTSSTSCIVVGFYTLPGSGAASYRSLAESWNGSEWSLLTTPYEAGGFNQLDAVSCTSSTSCTAAGSVGGKQSSLRWNGSEWSILAARKETSTANDISCSAANACTVVLSNSTKVERWNGSEWTVATPPTPEGGSAVAFNGVSCPSASACTAVGSYTKESKTVTLGERWNGSEWLVQSTPNLEGGGVFAGVSCNTSSKCTAVGYYKPKKGESKALAARYE